MPTQHRGRRRAAPEKFKDHPDIPPEDDADDSPVDEEEILAGSGDEGSDGENYAESEEDVDSTEGTNECAEVEEVKEPPKRPRGRPKGSGKKSGGTTTKKNEPKTTGAKKNTEDEEEPGKRYFKILVDSILPENNSPKVPVGDGKNELTSNGGRYTGKNPMQAAKKAFTRICRVATDGGECTYIFSIQETTQSSAKKVFPYRGIRKELSVPQEVTKGDTSYFIKFSSEVSSYKQSPTGGAKQKTSTGSKTKAVPAKKGNPAKSRTTTNRGKTRGRGRGKK
jgi:hypothetical protein